MNSSLSKIPRTPFSNLTNIIPDATSSSLDDVLFTSSNPITPSLVGDGGRREPGSVYSRRKCNAKSKLKGKDVSVNGDSVCDKVNQSEVVAQDKSTVKPPKKKKQKTPTVENVANYSLPQDFIEKQRAYFAEIDAFQLSEEEASADDLV